MTQQALPLKRQLEIMESLQELDLKIDAVKKKKLSLPVALKTLDDSFNKCRLSVETKKNFIAELEKVYKQTHAAMDLNQDRVTRANSKLEGVQNSQEFQSANKEIEQLKKMNASLEEQMKRSTVDKDTATAELATLTAQFEKIKGELEAQQSVLAEQIGALDKEIATLDVQRVTYTAQVEKQIISYYNRIRVARAGVGIVPAIGGRCSGCNMMVPPQLYNEVQRAIHMQSCPACHRVLFVPMSASASVAG